MFVFSKFVVIGLVGVEGIRLRRKRLGATRGHGDDKKAAAAAVPAAAPAAARAVAPAAPAAEVRCCKCYTSLPRDEKHFSRKTLISFQKNPSCNMKCKECMERDAGQLLGRHVERNHEILRVERQRAFEDKHGKDP